MIIIKSPQKGTQIRFGQGSRPEVSINPQSGQLGTRFYFNAIRFDRGVSVQVEIINSQGYSIYRNTISTD